MNEETITYSLDFIAFSLDFDVKKKASIEWTLGFDSHGPDFVFAVAEIWLKAKEGRYLLVSEFDTGNLIETLKNLALILRNPNALPEIDGVPLGGLCAWQRGYWERLRQDCGASNDEKLYDLFAHLFFSTHDANCIAIYKYKNIATIEVAVQSGFGGFLDKWCEFDPELMASKTDELMNLIVSAIKNQWKSMN